MHDAKCLTSARFGQTIRPKPKQEKSEVLGLNRNFGYSEASVWAEASANQLKHSKINQDSEVVILQFQYASIQITSVRHSKLDICTFNSLSIWNKARFLGQILCRPIHASALNRSFGHEQKLRHWTEAQCFGRSFGISFGRSFGFGRSSKNPLRSITAMG